MVGNYTHETNITKKMFHFEIAGKTLLSIFAEKMNKRLDKLSISYEAESSPQLNELDQCIGMQPRYTL